VTTETTHTDEVTTAASEHTAAVSGLFGRDLIYMAFWALQLILVACVTPILTRLIRQEALGLVAASTAVMQLLNVVFSFGLQTAVQREHSGDYGDHGARQLVTLAAVLSLMAGLLTYLTGRWWSPLIGLGPFPAAVRYAVIWAVLIAATGPALSLVRSRDQLRWFVAIGFAQSIFAQMLALALVIFVSSTASEYLLGQVLGQVVAAGLALAVAKPARLTRVRRRMFTGALRFSTGLVPAMVASFFMAASDRLVIQADLGARTTSHYAVASNIGSFTIGLLGFLDFVWLPRLFAIKDTAARRLVLGASRDGLYVLGAAFAIAIAYAAPVILWIWCPPSYHPHTLLPICAVIAASALPFADGVVYTQALILAGRTTAVAAATIVAAVMNLLLNLALVPKLGITGSAGITFCCYMVYAVMLRRMAGASGPATSARAFAIAFTGFAVCMSSAVVPYGGIALGPRIVVSVTAGVVFVAELVTLIKPQSRKRLDGWLVRTRGGAIISRLTSPETPVD
jgi:O-antigen/teichoic acid export membrane protein